MISTWERGICDLGEHIAISGSWHDTCSLRILVFGHQILESPSGRYKVDPIGRRLASGHQISTCGHFDSEKTNLVGMTASDPKVPANSAKNADSSVGLLVGV